MKISIHTALAAALLIGLSAYSTPNCSAKTSPPAASAKTSTVTKAQIRALFNHWNAALATGNPKAVVALYAPDSVLLPTVSNKPRTTRAGLLDYFKHFLMNKPHGEIDKSFVRIYGNTAVDSGLYTFTFKNGSKVHARFTYVYHKQPDGKWLIVEHHSSALPEKVK